MRNAIKIASLAAAALLATTSASAQVVTFASFLSNGGATNMRFVRSASGNTAAGRTITFHTTTTATSGAGGTAVNFQFQNLGAFSAFVGNVGAVWTMNGTVTNTAATMNGTTITQTELAGSFSIIANTPISYGTGQTAVVNGTNLLSGTFSKITLSGENGGSTGSVAGSTTGGSVITFTSDFLTFLPLSNLDMGLTLTSISPLLAFTANRAVAGSGSNTFRASAIGAFSADPPPVPPSIPEPGTWAMMIAGMSLVGFARRRRRTAVAA